MSERILIKGGRLFDPGHHLDEVGDLLIENGKIEAAGRVGNVSDAKVIQAAGLLVTPGWIDVHTHLREPGGAHKETVFTGTRSAAAGGFTTLACMANTNPVNDNGYVTSYLKQKIASEAVVNVHMVGAISKGLLGEDLAEIGSMVEAGIIAISDDGKTVMNAYVMRKAMDYSRMFNLPVIIHAEDSCLKGRGVMNEGFNSARFGLRGIPKASEEIIVARDLLLAELTGARLHVAHVSTKGSVDLIRAAKRRGVKVTAEATPHHLTLTDDAVGNYDTSTKVAPPLRESEDVSALREGLRDGTIDVLASDHAPHSIADKEVEYDQAEFGMVGFETAFPLYLSVVNDGHMTLETMISAMTSKPAKLLAIARGTLQRNAVADVTICDLNAAIKVDKTKLYSKSQNTPFHGWELKGRVKNTIVSGRQVFPFAEGDER